MFKMMLRQKGAQTESNLTTAYMLSQFTYDKQDSSSERALCKRHAMAQSNMQMATNSFFPPSECVCFINGLFLCPATVSR